MRRSALLTVAVLGGLVSLIGGTVLYSALQDTARTGTNLVESAALGASADIQLATWSVGICGAFSEDLTTGLFTVTGVSPGASNIQFFCIKNVGSQLVALNVLADELTDVDFACTGDEALAGDTTCGGDLAGELSSVLSVGYAGVDCTTAVVLSGGAGLVLKANETTPHSFGTLGAGATGCFQVELSYFTSTANTAVQTAQSDRATWRFRFTAQA